jgi:NAD-dependent deacetylase
MDDAQRQRIRDAAARGPIVFLTGAGISAESGIPTFRGPEGFWTVGSRVYRPEELATRAAFGVIPEESWRWYLWRRAACRAAAPNPGHLALAELERTLGDRARLVTQNVDGLHLRAGSSPARTYQIHGNLDFTRCADECTPAIEPLAEDLVLRDRDAPLGALAARLRCPRCAGWLRPHVLWFDETYDEPRFRFESSRRAAAGCALLVTIGTSAATNLPNQMAALAARQGALIVDINPDGGPFAELAARHGIAVRASAGEAVPALCRVLTAG